MIVAAGHAATNREAAAWLRDGIVSTLIPAQWDLGSRRRSRGVNAHLRDERLAHIWHYVDEDGTLLYDVLRLEGYDKDGSWTKRFLQRRPFDGKWIWHLHATCDRPSCICHSHPRAREAVSPTALYRPELRAAIAARKPIVVTEGELCADAMRSLGVVATTPSGGSSGTITASFLRALSGASKITVFADCDDAGRAWAHNLARRLPANVCRRIDIAPDRRDGYDVANFIAERKRDGSSTADILQELRTLARRA